MEKRLSGLSHKLIPLCASGVNKARVEGLEKEMKSSDHQGQWYQVNSPFSMVILNSDDIKKVDNFLHNLRKC